jgi:hypothetical protein
MQVNRLFRTHVLGSDLTNAQNGQMRAEPFDLGRGDKVNMVFDGEDTRGVNTATGQTARLMGPGGKVVVGVATPWHTVGMVCLRQAAGGGWRIRWRTRRICMILLLLPVLIWIWPAHPQHQGVGHKLLCSQCAPNPK